MTAGEKLTVSVTASDPDGRVADLEVASDNAAVVTGIVTRANGVILTAHASGMATITVTATDDEGATGTMSFAVTVEAVPNRVPVVAVIAHVEVSTGATQSVAVPATDADGDAVTLTAISASPEIATVVVVGRRVSVTGRRAGTARITV